MLWDDGPDAPGAGLARAVADLRRDLAAHPERHPRGLTVRLLLGNSIRLGDLLDPTANAYHAARHLLEAGVPLVGDTVPGWRLEIANYAYALPHSHVKLVVQDGETVLTGGFNVSLFHVPAQAPGARPRPRRPRRAGARPGRPARGRHLPRRVAAQSGADLPRESHTRNAAAGLLLLAAHLPVAAGLDGPRPRRRNRARLRPLPPKRLHGRRRRGGRPLRRGPHERRRDAVAGERHPGLRGQALRAGRVWARPRAPGVAGRRPGDPRAGRPAAAAPRLRPPAPGRDARLPAGAGGRTRPAGAGGPRSGPLVRPGGGCTPRPP